MKELVSDLILEGKTGLGWEIRRAKQDDLPALVALSVAAFRDDERYKPPGAQRGGPKGHDRIDYHEEWMRKHPYIVCVHQNRLAGSIMVDLTAAPAWILGIHVDPAFMGQGIGSAMLKAVERVYPSTAGWTLQTPDYATRNHRFYEKNGFTLASVTDTEPDLGFGFHIYEKQTRRAEVVRHIGR